MNREHYDDDALRGCGCLIVLGSVIIVVAGFALIVWVILGHHCVSREPSQLELLFASRAPIRNASAVERTIRALRDLERLEAIDAALIAAARTTARALDHAPNPYVAGTVGRIHLEALRLLTARPAPPSDELDDFLRSLRRAPAVRNAEEP